MSRQYRRLHGALDRSSPTGRRSASPPEHRPATTPSTSGSSSATGGCRCATPAPTGARTACGSAPSASEADVRARRLAFAVVSIPALVQVALLVYAVARRVAYPYDLEWMEGGMLNHALRLADGRGIYVPPSVHFVPYLYTPLYPAVLAALGHIAGLSYALGRAVSDVALAAVLALGALAIVRRERSAVAWAGAAAFA